MVRKEEFYDYEDDKKGSGSLKIWITIMIILIILILVVGLRINKINVIGNKTYTEEEVTEMIFPDMWSRNSIVCFVKNRFFKKQKFPFIEDYDIQFKSPLSCDLVVYEKSIVGYIEYMSSYMYFDKDGVIVESSSQKIEGVPGITGLSFGHIVLNEPLPIANKDVFSDIMNITQRLKYYGIESEKIDFNYLNEATVFIDKGNIEVRLGNDSGMDEKISLLNDMLPKIREKGLKGSLDLRNYSDKEKKQNITFKIRNEGNG